MKPAAVLAEALRLAALGLRVAVFDADGRPGRFVQRDRDEHGNPIPGSGWQAKATTDSATIAHWFEAVPDSQLRVLMGRNFAPLGYAGVVLDVDRPGGAHGFEADGIGSLKRLQAEFGPLPKTRVHRTPGGGFHLLFAGPLEEPLTSRLGKLASYPGLHVVGDGGISPWPPSCRTGLAAGAYMLVRELPLDAVPPLPNTYIELLRDRPNKGRRADFPHGLGDAESEDVQAYLRSAVEGELARLKAAASGERNIVLNRVSFVLGRLAWAIERRDLIFVEIGRRAEEIGLEPYEIESTRDSGWYTGLADPRSLANVGFYPNELASKLWKYGAPIARTPAEAFIQALAPGLTAYPTAFRYKAAYELYPAALMVRVALDDESDIAGLYLRPLNVRDGAALTTIGLKCPSLPVILRADARALIVTTDLDTAITMLGAAPEAGVVFAPNLHRLECRLPMTLERVLIAAPTTSTSHALESALVGRGTAVFSADAPQTRSTSR